VRYIPALLVNFIVIDLIIGFHDVNFFTWGSVVLIDTEIDLVNASPINIKGNII